MKSDRKQSPNRKNKSVKEMSLNGVLRHFCESKNKPTAEPVHPQ